LPYRRARRSTSSTQELTGAGYGSRLAPHDAFWGGRYAILIDPDLNQVGLMGPIDPQRGFTPAV